MSKLSNQPRRLFRILDRIGFHLGVDLCDNHDGTPETAFFRWGFYPVFGIFFLVFSGSFGSVFSVGVPVHASALVGDRVILSATLDGGFTTYPYIGDIWTVTWADNDKLYAAFGDGTGRSDCLPELIPGVTDEFDQGYTEVAPGCYLPPSLENEYCEVFDCTPCLPLCVYTPAGLLELSGSLPHFDPCSGTEECRVGKHIPYGTLDVHLNMDKPSSLIFIDGRLYAHMHYPPGEPDYGYIAYSDDYGRNWDYVSGSPWDGDTNFEVVMFIQMGEAYGLNEDGYLYGLATSDEAADPAVLRDVYLLRVPTRRYTGTGGEEIDPILTYSDYEYYSGMLPNGEVVWSGSVTEAVRLSGLETMAQGAAMYHPGIDRYLFLSGLVGTVSGTVRGLEGLEEGYPLGALFEASNPWGPWTRVALLPAGYIAGLIPKGTEPDGFYFTAAGGGGLTYSLNVGHIRMEICPDKEAVYSDQVEVATSPAMFSLAAVQDTTVSLGISALDRLTKPSIDSRLFCNELLTGASLLVLPSGEALYSYSDPFERLFRGRTQYLENPDDEFEIFSLLPAGHPKPKVLLDLFRIDGEMGFDREMDVLYWDGRLTYKFDLGRPIREFRLTSPDGRHSTVVVDQGWTLKGPLVIRASTDNADWVELWRSADFEGRKEVGVEVPPQLLGDTVLYLQFEGYEYVLADLFVTARVDASDLTPLLGVPEGVSTKVYSDDLDSPHRAVVYWEGPFVKPVSSRTEFTWPDSSPLIQETTSTIRFLFPQQITVDMGRSSDGGITGITGLWLGERQVLKSPYFGVPPAKLQLLAAGEVGGVTDWPAYLRERLDNGGAWPKRGGRAVTTVDLSKSAYLGSRVEGATAILSLRVQADGVDGVLEWIFQPETQLLDGGWYSGISWRIRLDENLSRGYRFEMMEPILPRYGDWTMAQLWGKFLEARLDFAAPFRFSKKYYFAEMQPYYMATGTDGTLLSGFESPVPARVALSDEAARHLQVLEIPLRPGTVRETPKKLWLWSRDGVSDRWRAVDRWTDLYDELAAGWREDFGVGISDPKPRRGVLYSEDLHLAYLRDGTPSLSESFFVKFATDVVPGLGEMGFANILIDGPWLSDVHYPTDSYLPGAIIWEGSPEELGSANAPRTLDVAAAYGGEPGLKILVDRAKERGIQVTLWSTSGHFANGSPLMASNTHWIKWRIDGTPETADYGDITGVSLQPPYFDYHLGRLLDIRSNTGYEGVHFDSFLTFGVYEDGRRSQPYSEMDWSVLLQKGLREGGITEISIEGCGPFGISQGGWGYEPYRWGGPAEREEAFQNFSKVYGREYGLYRYFADMPPDPDVYYRALASKGVIEVWDDALSSYSDAQKERIAQANFDYMAVLDRMKRRRLIACGDTWYGVSWTAGDSTDEVVFSFEPFEYEIDRNAVVEDITTGNTVPHDGVLTTEAWHTYIVYGDSPGTPFTPTPTPVSTETPTPSPQPSSTWTPTPTETADPGPQPTPSPTPTATGDATSLPTPNPGLDPVRLLELIHEIQAEVLSSRDLLLRSLTWRAGPAAGGG